MYDYDACFVYSSLSSRIVQDSIQYLTAETGLKIAQHPWTSDTVVSFLEKISDDLDRSATCVLFSDPDSSTLWSQPELQNEVKRRLSARSIRLIFVRLSGSDATPDVAHGEVVDYDENHVTMYKALEAAIVGYTASTLSYAVPPVLPDILHKSSTISGVFLPCVTFESRPELDQLHAFWVDSSRNGVLALVGIGGSGKTSLLTRFLQELPVTPMTEQSLAAKSQLPAPNGLFLWSFYDNPNIEYFIRGLYEYLTGEKTIDAARDVVYQLIRHTENNHLPRLLIALDGLEIVQEGRDSTGGLGLLRDSSLRHFVRRIARGDLPVKLIVTSRYPLPELKPFEQRGYWVIDTNQLDRAAAQQLLRRKGVTGTDTDLDRLLLEYGTHVLTLDHLGQVLRDYFNGNSQAALTLPFARIEASDQQAQRLTRVLAFYEANLLPDELLVLGVVCVLQKPISFALLARLFNPDGKDLAARQSYFYNPDGNDTALQIPRIEQSALRELLARLQRRQLIAFYGGNSASICSVHPAIRAYFYNTFTELRSTTHAEVRTQVFSLLDRLQNFRRSITPQVLDIYEDVIFHAAHSDNPKSALQLYEQLGGYLHFGWRAGDYQRGLQLTSMLMEALGSEYVDVRTAPVHEHNLFLLDTGQPALAEKQTRELMSRCRSLAQHFDPDDPHRDWWHNPFAVIQQWKPSAVTQQLGDEFGFGMYEGVLLQTLCDTLLAQGKLIEARDLMDDALSTHRNWQERGNPMDGRSGSNPYGRRALAQSLLGEVNNALDDFKAADRFAREHTRFTLIISAHWYHKPFHALLLARLGRLEAAHKRLETLDYDELQAYRPLSAAQYELAAAEIAYLEGDVQSATVYVEKAQGWAMQSGQQHIYVQALLMQARLLMRTHQWEKAAMFLSESREVARSCQFNIQLIDNLVLTGYLFLQTNDGIQGETFAHEALTLSESRTYRWGIGSAALLSAECAYQQEQYTDAKAYAERSLTVRKMTQDPRASHAQTLMQKLEPYLQ